MTVGIEAGKRVVATLLFWSALGAISVVDDSEIQGYFAAVLLAVATKRSGRRTASRC